MGEGALVKIGGFHQKINGGMYIRDQRLDVSGLRDPQIFFIISLGFIDCFFLFRYPDVGIKESQCDRARGCANFVT